MSTTLAQQRTLQCDFWYAGKMVKDFDRVIGLLREAKRVLVFTGAGISTGSGIPDFRGPQGVWKRRKPVTIQEFLASHDSRVDYWDYKLEGYEGFREAQPNEAHRDLTELERTGKLHGLLTQNIDGLHSAAGISDERLVELHGTNRKIRCLDCGTEREPDVAFRVFRETREPPICDGCGGWMKPATISFGQPLLESDLTRAREWALEADFVMSLGSTLSVHPAASFPLMAARLGATYLVVNQGPTDHDDLADFRWEADLAKVLPELIRRSTSVV